jgi:hypothetical protein
MCKKKPPRQNIFMICIPSWFYCLKLNLLKCFLQAGFSLQIICIQYIENIFSVNIKL